MYIVDARKISNEIRNKQSIQTKTTLSLEDDSFMGKPLRNTLKTLSAGPTPRGAQDKSMCVGDGYIDVLAGTRSWVHRFWYILLPVLVSL